MPKPPRKHVDDLRGASRLALEATRAITDVVETMHRTIASGPPMLGSPLARPARVLTKLAYTPMRKATDLVGAGLDAALKQLGPLLGQSVPGAEREAMVAALNGVLGDYLEETANPLAIRMSLRRPEGPVGRKVVLLVHGSSMNDLQWNRHGHDHGAALARDRGYSPVYVHYNSGRHISTNGQQLATLLEELMTSSREPIDEIVIVAHSMGGLVARAALAAGEKEDHAWRSRVRKAIFLGSPHHGAPLERQGNWVDALLGFHPYSAPLARLGKIRSAGVTDMRFGVIEDAQWKGSDRFAHAEDPRKAATLPTDVICYAIAATQSKSADKALRSDGLVPVDSALGRHSRNELTLRFENQNQLTVLATGHLDLLDRPDVYEQIRKWIDDSVCP